MKWFKFYGQDWLTDMKVQSMSMEDRLCYVTLLSLASSNDNEGVVKNCTESALIRLSNIPDWVTQDYNPYERATGCLERYKALHCVTINDNGDVTVINFNKRQGENLSNAERQKNYRENKKMANNKIKKTVTKSNESNVTRYNDSNSRIDKIREEKNIETVAVFEKTSYGDLKGVNLSDEEYKKLVDLMGDSNLNSLIFELDTYMASKGKRYKSHYATLLNWAKRKHDNKVKKESNIAFY